jgi:hypothetical protein
VAILTHFNPNHEYIIDTNASDFMRGIVLSEQENDDMLYTLTYHSRTFAQPEINYHIQDNKFHSILDSSKIWRKYFDHAFQTIPAKGDKINKLLNVLE